LPWIRRERMRTKRIGAILLAAIVVAAIGAGAIALMSETATSAEAGPCICPQVYAPVVCDNGRTYPNQCVADCRHARNCVPTGDL